MNFTSTLFLFWFFPIFLLIYFLLPTTKLKNLFLLLSSLYFYSTGEPIFVYVMILSILINYFIARQIHHSSHFTLRRFLLILSVLLNFSLLAFFKYTNFILSTINTILSWDLPMTSIPLPIGISFFTFQAASYVFDVYYDEAENDFLHYQNNILSFALYISLFPQLVAGPIVRYSDIAVEIGNRQLNIYEINEGIRRFIYGLSKKILLANSMSIVADRAFSLDPPDAGFPMLMLGAVSYTFQIYFDFSGYSDMAIGIGKMLGFQFPENFDHPYMATSITDFWRRWHQTLSSWFRDYLYIPMGGSWYGLPRTIFNLFVVWTLTGLWHGANWTFVLWGFLYFLFLSMEKSFREFFQSDLDEVLPLPLCRFLTLSIVILLWVIFRSESIHAAWRYLSFMFHWGNLGPVPTQALFYLRDFAPFYLFALLACTNCFESLGRLLSQRGWDEHPLYTLLQHLLLLLLLMLCSLYIIKGSYNPFIYFNF